VLPLERIARIDCKHWLYVQVFTPLQELKKAETIGRPIGPRRLVSRTIHARTDRLLPVIPVGERVAFKIVASWQAEKMRMHGSHALHQVRPKAIGTVVECRRKERHELQPQIARMRSRDLQMVLRGRSNVTGRKRILIKRTINGPKFVAPDFA